MTDPTHDPEPEQPLSLVQRLRLQAGDLTSTYVAVDANEDQIGERPLDGSEEDFDDLRGHVVEGLGLELDGIEQYRKAADELEEAALLHEQANAEIARALHEVKIAEMATGEGKTLLSVMPAYLNGLSGMGVHLVTVNDYLARRDSEWVGPIHEFLLLTVDCVDKYQPNSISRKQAYECDIVYGTNSEFGFDYLRDNMVISPDELVQRKHHYAMVDEVDSVLIDDARTPLIISGPVAQGQEEQEYLDLKPKVEKVIEAQRRLATHVRHAFRSGNSR